MVARNNSGYKPFDIQSTSLMHMHCLGADAIWYLFGLISDVPLYTACKYTYYLSHGILGLWPKHCVVSVGMSQCMSHTIDTRLYDVERCHSP